MGGFVGEATFSGDISEFLPFLKLGEYLHIGKGTVYGLGKYEIKEEWNIRPCLWSRLSVEQSGWLI